MRSPESDGEIERDRERQREDTDARTIDLQYPASAHIVLVYPNKYHVHPNGPNGFVFGVIQTTRFDTGISEGAIPFLKSLAESRNLSLVEVPFISIGADLAGYARFEGQNSEGPGSGTLPVVMSTSQGPDSPGRMILDDFFPKLRPLPRFVHLKPGVMNATNTIGAIEKALHSGMPAMSLRLHEILSIFLVHTCVRGCVRCSGLPVLRRSPPFLKRYILKFNFKDLRGA